ncbi:Three-deoxy-D-manno-octulosonic-acid transferase domain-containing protein [Emticicia oligotrophica DSM 17448]|uniref:3-deoxy-D-manno-octulosonic acid transferase n=1 Tax=Emticicia oligotrophica (strain DSM 17448 / CIP 109782 / MTCC 6937 / GPTSA100-15) TaxID=929562 RepID=A0ABN4AKE3_EMTOG|nr:glycosyltransferase N-terminal domain-containing protein [Emticicia oligotrophica]AFK02570.1 Three-deoxy-D-manno-octulosonic-acid transferase domain-containing protein [Emticicia oligotrophica DSM 17448]
MLQILYNFSIYAYTFIINVLAPFNSKAKLWVDGRKNIFERLDSASLSNRSSASLSNRSSASVSNSFTERSRGSLAWFHCASLGEFEQGRPVIEAFRAKYPAYKILVTFFSPSGYEIRKNYAGADFIFYLPADTPSNARKFIEIVQPSIVYFVKYEFWRNYLTELERKQIPAISFSTIFRPNQFFFKPYGRFYREILKKFKHILVQNQESFDLLKSIDIEQITLAGDTRFDRVKQIVDAKKDIPIAERFKANRQVFMVGSAWQTDMEVLIPLMNSLQNDSNLTFVIAPHEIHREEINTWQKQIELKSICFSEVKDETQLNNYQVLIVDNIGMLSSLYQYADFAFIGGSFGKGLHNTLEAATFGMPIFFGNRAYHKFKEAVDLVRLGGAFAISSTEELAEILKDLRSNEVKKKESDKISQNYVLQNIGATEKVMAITQSILND